MNQHPLMIFAEYKLDVEVGNFKTSGGANWTELKIAMMRFQQAYSITKDSNQADLNLDAALLSACEVGSWGDMLKMCGEPIGD